MVILYITPFSIKDNIVSSGTVVSIKKALEEAGNEVAVIDGLKVSLWQKVKKKLIGLILKKEYDPYREPSVLKKMNKEVLERAVGIEYDVVFSQTSVLCAYYTGNKPIVFFTDATFGGMLHYYVEPSTWYRPNMIKACETERLALKNCTKAIFASEWAVNSAIRCHDGSPDKCVAINRGANIEHNLSAQNMRSIIEQRNVLTRKNFYKLLFVGRDWERKGGNLALEVVKKMNDLGYPAKLIIVGCQPPINEDNVEFVETVGFLNKANYEDNLKLQNYYLYSDFYLQPSKQEAQGIAYAEASAFGLPVFAVNTGGVSDIVTNKNGCLLDSDDTADCYVEKLLSLINNQEEYRRLAMSAFMFYQEKLNWKSVGERLTEVLELSVHPQ